MARLVALAGLPGVGKTTVSRALCECTGAIHLRVDSIETALKTSTLKIAQAEDAGYVVLAAVAADNLRLGFDVIADTVNPIAISRQLWTDCASGAGAELVNVELVCSDVAEHRRRVETRVADLKNHVLPDWQAVLDREYERFPQARLVLDTAQLTPEACAARIAEAMEHRIL